jgi:hypothetical protein
MQAGDITVLLDTAARVARDEAQPASIAKALGLLDAAGLKNRASAARAIYLRLDHASRSDRERAAALFYGFLSQDLDRMTEDPAPSVYPRDRVDTRESVRGATAQLPATWVVKEWRDARD